MSNFFREHEEDLQAHQPDTQEYWIQAINFQASQESQWRGQIPHYALQQPPYPYSPYPPQAPPIGTSFAWPMYYNSGPPEPLFALPAPHAPETQAYVAPAGETLRGGGANGSTQLWTAICFAVLFGLALSGLGTLIVPHSISVSSASWVDQVPTTANTWNHQCMHTIPTVNDNPYSVIGKPDLTADFVDKILAYYHSPAAGDGQQFIDATSRCGIKVGAALAFFMHESTLGTAGEARSTLSLGNMRCYAAFSCINVYGQPCQARQSCYAAFPSWPVGFVIWSRMMRNLYVDTWGKITIDQEIPSYAPSTDNNNEAAYISSWKYCIDTWHKGVIAV